MDVFENTKALDDGTKNRVRHRVWGTLQGIRSNFSQSSDADVFVAILVLAVGFIAAVSFAFIWTRDQRVLLRLGAVTISLSICVVTLAAAWIEPLLDSIRKGRLAESEWVGPAVYLSIIALDVFVLRGLRSVHLAFAWISSGIPAGVLGSLILAVGLILVRIVGVIAHLVSDHRKWLSDPELGIVTSLLNILEDLELLEKLDRTKNEMLVMEIENRNRIDEKLGELNSKIPKIVNTQMYNEVIKQRDGTLIRKLKIVVTDSDGQTKTLIEEQPTLRQDPFDDDPRQWTLGKQIARYVREAAMYIERGLAARFSVDDGRVDSLVRMELSQRAETVRSWVELIALPSRETYSTVLKQVGTVLVCVVEDNWAEIPTHEYKERQGWVKRIVQSLPRTAIGLIPIVVIAVAPRLGLYIPSAVKDSIVTFAIPWLLLQIIQLLVPNASDYLSQSKSVRELLPSFGTDKD